MDKFFNQKYCDRCGGSLEAGRTMSMYNNDCICLKYKEAETRRADYKKAVEADHEAIKAGNYNFAGIGLDPNLKQTESYIEMHKRHTAEFNALPLGFAFSKEQYLNVLNKWGITEAEAESGALLSIGGGGFIRATDKELYINTVNRIQDEENAAIEADKTGTGFIYQMFLYELQNHEFIITRDTDETLTALGISEKDLEKNAALRYGLCKAVSDILAAED